MIFDFLLLVIVSISVIFILYKMIIKVYIVTKIRQASDVETCILRPETILITRQYNAIKTTLQSVLVFPHISGFIEKVFVHKGQYVKAGELLFTIQQRQYLVQKEITYANLKRAQSLLNQAQQYLYKSEQQQDKSEAEVYQAQQSFLTAQTNVSKAENEFKIADTNFSYTFIRSPIEGSIQELNTMKGNYVSPAGCFLAKIINASKTSVMIKIPKNQYLQYVKNKQTECIFKIQSSGNFIFSQSGILKQVEDDCTLGEKMMCLYIDFPQIYNRLDTAEHLIVSMNCKQKNVLLVDENLVYNVGKRPYVYLAFQGKIKRRAIVIGEKIDHRYIVKKGLNANDELITTHIQPIQIGCKIVSQIRRIYLNKIVLERKIKEVKA